jgi:hypothetical protein
MGTALEWMQVLGFGGIFAVAMLVLDAIRDPEGFAKLPNLFATTVSAVVVGMLGVLLVAFGTGFVIRAGRKRAEIASKLG